MAGLPETRRLGAGQPQSMNGMLQVQPQKACSSSSGAQRPAGAGIVPEGVVAGAHRPSQGDHGLIPAHHRSQKLERRRAGLLRRSQRRGNHRRPRMEDGALVDIIHLQNIAQRAVDHRGRKRGALLIRADRRTRTDAFRRQAAHHGAPGDAVGSGDGAAGPVQDMQGRPAQIRLADRTGDPFGEALRERRTLSGHKSLVACPTPRREGQHRRSRHIKEPPWPQRRPF